MAAPVGSSPESQFRYSASARPCAVRFGAFPAVDSLELPPAGGRVHLRWERSRYPGILAFDYAYAEAHGEFNERENAWQTRVHIAIERCSIADVLTIGHISATLGSVHRIGSGLPSFVVANAAFSDVRIAGIPMEVITNYPPPFTYEDLKADFGSRSDRFRRASEIRGGVASSFVEGIRAAEKLPGVEVEGNLITVPQLGRIRFGEFVTRPQSCALSLVNVEFVAPIRGQADLGLLSVLRVVERTMPREEPEEEDLEPTSTNLDEEEEAEVLEDLKEWLNSEPEPDSPFLFFMGHSLTPAQFYREVEERTSFGIAFLRFLSDQSKRFDEHPRDAIRRAIDANRAG
jgi:hypothetical protein